MCTFFPALSPSMANARKVRDIAAVVHKGKLLYIPHSSKC